MNTLSFNEFQTRAIELALMKGEKFDVPLMTYRTLGLAGEAGEVSEKVKKLIRDQAGVVTPEFVEAVKKELGDVLWYLAALADILDLTLQDVAESCIRKIEDRAARGVRHGEGDNR